MGILLATKSFRTMYANPLIREQYNNTLWYLESLFAWEVIEQLCYITLHNSSLHFGLQEDSAEQTVVRWANYFRNPSRKHANPPTLGLWTAPTCYGLHILLSWLRESTLKRLPKLAEAFDTFRNLTNAHASSTKQYSITQCHSIASQTEDEGLMGLTLNPPCIAGRTRTTTSMLVEPSTTFPMGYIQEVSLRWEVLFCQYHHCRLARFCRDSSNIRSLVPAVSRYMVEHLSEGWCGLSHRGVAPMV